MALMSALVVIPTTRAFIYADEGKKESSAHERSESAERQQKEEQSAYTKYEKDYNKYGAADTRTKKAWKRYQHELAEHGHANQGKPPLG